VLDLAPFVQLPTPLVDLLRKKYDYSVNQAGLDRAVELAAKIRATPRPPSPESVAPATAVPLGPSASSTAPSTQPPPGH